jgi:uncharacterized membrane protein YczE
VAAFGRSLLLPVPSDQRPRRFAQLYPGLLLYGFSAALLVEAELGLDPWDVFHQGVAELTGITIGVATVIISAVVLLLWIPLWQRPGVGTISNGLLIGFAIDAALVLLPTPDALWARVGFLASGIVLNGIATGLYIGAGMGPGPRDGLMTGLAARGHSIRVVRTGIELSVLVLGYLLGGSVGIGTVIYALSIGPLAHITIPFFRIGEEDGTIPDDAHASIV